MKEKLFTQRISTFSHFLIFTFVFIANFLFIKSSLAQAPEKFNYQAVVRDNSGNIVANQPVSFRISIVQGTVYGASVYVETQKDTTNAYGLSVLKIGDGIPLTGTMAGINWANGPYFIKVELDQNGGTTYVLMGITQLISVPYALYSKTSGSTTETDPIFSASPANGITGTNITNWNTAYGWGNHAAAGYLTTEMDGAVGNEVTNATNLSLIRSGSGTSVSPFTLALNLANTNTWTGAQTFVANTNFPGSGIWNASGNVGIGTSSPAAQLHTTGSVRFQGAGTPGIGKILSSDANGNATWQSAAGLLPTGTPGQTLRNDGSSWIANSLLYNNGTKIGIGTVTPLALLQIGDSGLMIKSKGEIQTIGVGNGTVAGNTRGIGAIDLQTRRDSAVRVASGQYSVIGGGYSNKTNAAYAAVGGGQYNTANNTYAAVHGGYFNTASGAIATIGGGDNNTASGSAATVGGGRLNVSSGYRGTVGGGYNNQATNNYSTVGGGYSNTASGYESVVSGGDGNIADTSWTTVSGGIGNMASGIYSTVTGGTLNIARGDYSWVGGSNMRLSETADSSFALGVSKNPLNITQPNSFIIYTRKVGIRTITPGALLQVGDSGLMIKSKGEIQTTGVGNGIVAGNIRGIGAIDLQTKRDTAFHVASGNYSVIGGGHSNRANNVYSTVSGGFLNTASGYGSNVGGGYGCKASNGYATIGGGYYNVANGTYTTLGGGYNNTASNNYATVGGGYFNTVSGDISFVGGGENNVASGSAATICGGRNNISSGSRAFIGGGYYNQATNSYTTVGGGYGNIAKGYESTIGGGDSNHADTSYSTVSGGLLNKASGINSTVPGGYGNIAAGDYSFASGRNMQLSVTADRTFAWGNATSAVNITQADAFIIYSGNVGIGTTTPSYQLQLSTNSAAKPTSNTWTIVSDARLKTNISDYSAGLDALLKIHPVWFTYTGEAGMPKETGVGVLAQELQKIAPYMVGNWTYKSEDGKSEDYLSVDNGAMTYMIVNSIKELAKQNEQLQKQNELLQKQIDELKQAKSK